MDEDILYGDSHGVDDRLLTGYQTDEEKRRMYDNDQRIRGLEASQRHETIGQRRAALAASQTTTAQQRAASLTAAFRRREAFTLEATWWLMDREAGMDETYNQAALDRFEETFEAVNVKIFQDGDGDKRLFLARFEWPQYGESPVFPEAYFAGNEAVGFIDFLGGMPLDCCEMLIAMGEKSTQAGQIAVKEGGKITAPIPEKFFDWPDRSKVLFNLTALPTKNYGKFMAKGLEGEPEPTNLHWWFRVNVKKTGDDDTEIKFPVPGEFLALGVRMMPGKPWGHQQSNPFIYSGNWMDTVFYTGGVVKEVIEPTDETPYATYKIFWRVTEKEEDGIITAIPSDFSEYRVGDWVCILKDVGADKKSQLWKDEDLLNYGDNWQIAPITFYGLEEET